MVYMKIKVINDTIVPIELKQGLANVPQKLCTLQPKGTPCSVFSIGFESATTYREYWCDVQPLGTEAHSRVIFSSDDSAEYKEVKIVEEPEGSKKYTWKGTVMRTKGPTVDTPQAADQAPATPSTIWKRFTGLFTK